MMHRYLTCLVLSIALAVVAVSPQERPATSPAAECFPFERLPDALQPRAEELLLRALDGEALYTIAGGLKPMSSGFVSSSMKVDAPDLADAEVTRQILVMLPMAPEVRADACHESLYNCSSSCSGQTCEEVCQECGAGYVPGPGGGTGSCGAVGSGKCDFECGLGTCYGYSCTCVLPI